MRSHDGFSSAAAVVVVGGGVRVEGDPVRAILTCAEEEDRAIGGERRGEEGRENTVRSYLVCVCVCVYPATWSKQGLPTDILQLHVYFSSGLCSSRPAKR